MPVLTSYPDSRLRLRNPEPVGGYGPQQQLYPPPPAAQESGLDMMTLIQLLMTLPTLRKSGDTLQKVVTNLAALPVPNKLAVMATPSPADINALIDYSTGVRNALYDAAGADKDSFDSLRKSVLFDLLPVLMSQGQGGGNNSMMMFVLLFVLMGNSSTGSLF